jgi:hypothetical protein
VIPAVLVPLGALPQAPPPFGAWRRFLGSCGVTVAAAFREDPVGWTIVGERALAALGAPDAESAMDEAERNHVALLKSMGAPSRPVTPETAWTVRVFRLLDGETGSPIPPVTEYALITAIHGVPPLDGDPLAIGGARLRRTTA